jgi:hypothetical protein
VRILTAEGYKTLALAHPDLFVVNTGLDVDHYSFITLNMIHRLLHGLEITGPVSRDHDLPVAHKKAQKAQKY